MLRGREAKMWRAANSMGVRRKGWRGAEASALAAEGRYYERVGLSEEAGLWRGLSWLGRSGLGEGDTVALPGRSSLGL